VVYSLDIHVMEITHAHHIQFIPLPVIEQGLKLGYVVFTLSIWVNLLIKISVALMLLRIKSTFAWRIGLWTLIACCVAVGFAATFTQLYQCRPLRAFWDIELRGTGACWPDKTVLGLAYAWGGERDLVHHCVFC
jgi:hypothetical protein